MQSVINWKKIKKIFRHNKVAKRDTTSTLISLKEKLTEPTLCQTLDNFFQLKPDDTEKELAGRLITFINW